MKQRFYFEEIQDWCKAISKIKENIIEELPHFAHQSLYFKNDEITSGLLNNKIEIKIHLLTGHLHYFDNEKNYIIDLINDVKAQKKFLEIFDKINFGTLNLKKLHQKDLLEFHTYAVKAIRILELFHQTLQGKFSLVHLWPHHFDFSTEWYSVTSDQQIGTGISPGDEKNPEPYLYMNPWPFSENMLKIEIPIGQWNTTGWNGIKINFENLQNNPEHFAKVSELFLALKTNLS